MSGVKRNFSSGDLKLQKLEFNDIHYAVKPPKHKEPLKILKGVSGGFQAGRFTAILGSSGAGKSTLLDILAQRKQSGIWSGTIDVDGQEIPDAKIWKRVCGYVHQHDKLLSTSTVFEALMFSTQLRTSYTTPYEEHVERCEKVLADLGLEHRRNARIGSHEKRSLSGGETRRVSVAVELVADVKALLLDEPTSGLDSTNAKSLVELLCKIAKEKNMIVAATLHQPSSSITAMFDDLILMANGQICYGGPMASLVPHFAAIGFSVPPLTNPTDYVMDLSIDHDTAKTLVANAHNSLELDQATDGRIGSSILEAVTREESSGNFATPFWFQFKLLWIRNFRQWIRNELLLASELIQYLFTGLFIGAMYANLSDQLDAGLFDRTSSIFFILTTLCFIPSFTIITVSGEQMPLFKREANSGMYTVQAHFLSKMCVTWPFELFLGLLFSICCYFLMGYISGAGHFFTFYAIVAVFLLLSETIGLLCASMTPNPTIGVLVLSIVLLVALALGGFLVSEPRDYYTWTEHINFFVYALTAATLNQFDGLILYQDGQPVGALDALKSAGRVRNDLSLWENWAVLVGMLLFFRFCAFLLVRRKVSSSTFAKSSKTVPDPRPETKPDTQQPMEAVV